MTDKRRQELYCHECGKYVQFDLDMDLNGNHVIECPECGHEHCRVVKDGRVTEVRWDQRNRGNNVFHATGTTSTTTSTFDTYTNAGSTGGTYLTGTDAVRQYMRYQSWLNGTTNS